MCIPHKSHEEMKGSTSFISFVRHSLMSKEQTMCSQRGVCSAFLLKNPSLLVTLQQRVLRGLAGPLAEYVVSPPPDVVQEKKDLKRYRKS
jgi:hypothetical protein